MAITFLSWNVRHFRGDENRAQEVSRLVSSFDPDIFGLLEFKAKAVMRTLMFNSFPAYDFAVTDSKMGTEITVGWKRSRFQQAIWTQKREFLSGNINLRPGGLLSINENGVLYNFLFLHTDSGTGENDYNNRQDMFKKIWKLNEALTEISASNTPNLVALGDLNTMGRGTSLTGEDEIEELAADASGNGMRILSKDESNTWHQWGKGPRGNRRPLQVSEISSAMRSDLDHMLVSQDIEIGVAGVGGEEMQVKGWNQLDGQERVDFLWDVSDHSAIYGKIS